LKAETAHHREPPRRPAIDAERSGGAGVAELVQQAAAREPKAVASRTPAG